MVPWRVLTASTACAGLEREAGKTRTRMSLEGTPSERSIIILAMAKSSQSPPRSNSSRGVDQRSASRQLEGSDLYRALLTALFTRVSTSRVAPRAPDRSDMISEHRAQDLADMPRETIERHWESDSIVVDGA